ncbi:hypothetical protein [Natrialbaceae archaeon AArc-T1-2]|nr:hypothetical protein [Natrialbaceae archaeon AArc-T1-2]WIV67764.1 hypothetical protein QQ977_03260 [Natrialbaceae archaeon AArc-T1-2]
MNELLYVALETETELPMELAGWGTLLLALIVTFAWLAYLYR